MAAAAARLKASETLKGLAERLKRARVTVGAGADSETRKKPVRPKERDWEPTRAGSMKAETSGPRASPTKKKTRTATHTVGVQVPAADVALPELNEPTLQALRIEPTNVDWLVRLIVSARIAGWVSPFSVSVSSLTPSLFCLEK